MPDSKYPSHEAMNPFFEVVMEGLSGFVDGEPTPAIRTFNQTLSS